jgi:hypothetical protein
MALIKKLAKDIRFGSPGATLNYRFRYKSPGRHRGLRQLPGPGRHDPRFGTMLRIVHLNEC